MFSTSTQRRQWMYEHPKQLDEHRHKANKSAGKSILKAGKVTQDALLSPKEELYILRNYLMILREFCRKFVPQMRKSVIATAFMYMKRFYLLESCMEYHPRNIGVTCAYLACKIDEFNVSIEQFIKNINGDCKKAQKTVLSNELLLMKKLKFHLTVHTPFRALEGFLIDMRARFTQARDKIDSISREEIEDFLDKTMFTDACFLYTPSQIALSAITHAAEKSNVDLEPYLTDIIFAKNPKALENFRVASDNIKRLIERDLQNSPGKDVIKKIEKKLVELK